MIVQLCKRIYSHWTIHSKQKIFISKAEIATDRLRSQSWIQELIPLLRPLVQVSMTKHTKWALRNRQQELAAHREESWGVGAEPVHTWPCIPEWLPRGFYAAFYPLLMLFPGTRTWSCTSHTMLPSNGGTLQLARDSFFRFQSKLLHQILSTKTVIKSLYLPSIHAEGTGWEQARTLTKVKVSFTSNQAKDTLLTKNLKNRTTTANG